MPGSSALHCPLGAQPGQRPLAPQELARPRWRLQHPQPQQHPAGPQRAPGVLHHSHRLLEDHIAEPGHCHVYWLLPQAVHREIPVKATLKDHNCEHVAFTPNRQCLPYKCQAAILTASHGSSGLCVTLLTDAGAYCDRGSKKSGPSNVSSEDMWPFSAKPPMETHCRVLITKIVIAVFVLVPE